jgi:uncharacterized protein (TIGR02996 family)
MIEREALLAAIAAAPADDVPRLVFADWLEEHDDPLGEFIRLQIDLEPLQVPRADPRAELERVKLLHLSEVRDPETPRVQKLIREAKLLRLHEADWLGPAASLRDDGSAHFQAEFRRGFVASVQITLSAFRAHGEMVRQCCPALERLIVFGTLGRCKSLAKLPALAGLSALTLAGWITAADAAALANSPHLAELQSLTIWLGAEDKEETYRALAPLPSLHELVLVQRDGGLFADDDEELDRNAAALAAIVNEERGEPIARVERPFARLFPLDGIHIGWQFYAGHLPGSRPVLVVQNSLGKRPVLIYFDDDGYMVGEEQLDLSEKLVRPTEQSYLDVNEEELIEVLGKEEGFEPGLIFVREFQSELAQTNLSDNCDPRPTPNEDDNAHEYWKWSTGQFTLDDGNYWLDGLGQIHST